MKRSGISHKVSFEGISKRSEGTGTHSRRQALRFEDDTTYQSVSKDKRESKMLHAFASLRRLSKKAEDLETQLSFNNRPRSKVLRVFKHYQNISYLLLNQPRASILGKMLQGSIIFGILVNVIESILLKPENSSSLSMPLFVLDCFVLCVFSLEFLLRILSSTAFDERLRSLFSQPLLVVDIIAIMPMIVELLPTQDDLQIFIQGLSLLSLMKAISILKLFHFVRDASIFIKGLSRSLTSLLFLVLVNIVTTLIFAILVYYAEKSNPSSPFNKGIPTALWWAIVTLTTVGYGDIVPKTVAGRVIGGLTGICGMLLLALPVVILGYHFQEVYNEKIDEKIIEKVKEKEFEIKESLNHDQKETYFLKRRIESIEGSNRKIMGQLINSENIYKGVSKDLKALYKSVYTDVAWRQLERKETFKDKIKYMEKFKAAKKKIKLVHIFKNSDRRLGSQASSEMQFDKEDSFNKEENHLGKKPTRKFSTKSTIFDDLNDQDDMTHDVITKLKKMNDLAEKPSSMFPQRTLKSECQEVKLVAAESRQSLIPKIIVDKSGEIHQKSNQSSPNSDMFTPKKIKFDITSTQSQNLPMKNNKGLKSEMEEVSPYRSLSSVQSFSGAANSDTGGASKFLFITTDPHIRRCSADYPSVNHSHFKIDNSYLNPRFSTGKSRILKINGSGELYVFDENDSKGSSVIIDIPLKGIK